MINFIIILILSKYKLTSIFFYIVYIYNLQMSINRLRVAHFLENRFMKIRSDTRIGRIKNVSSVGKDMCTCAV